MTTLIIARHGNTFEPHETPTRVGARTDLPLAAKGRDQATALGRYLKTHNLMPDVAYTSPLRRTQETAKLALAEAGRKLPLYPLDIFTEIDYGEDENQPEAKVIARIGEKALKDWEEHAIVPEGWNANPQEIIENWQNFANQIAKKHDSVTGDTLDIDEIVLVLTSNGIARFAPHITGDYEAFKGKYPLKLATGALGILAFYGQKWHVRDWNIKPS